jgi:hypothetical protein
MSVDHAPPSKLIIPCTQFVASYRFYGHQLNVFYETEVG